uniref:Omp85 domain-containing protein n=1 Tax=Steinernema glaseri TaxID=37863 RepID=A0A1I8A1X9_9BILA
MLRSTAFDIELLQGRAATPIGGHSANARTGKLQGLSIGYSRLGRNTKDGSVNYAYGYKVSFVPFTTRRTIMFPICESNSKQRDVKERTTTKHLGLHIGKMAVPRIPMNNGSVGVRL